ncbi:hypothetical protein LguiA_012186 [Lonicera macranthoides]
MSEILGVNEAKVAKETEAFTQVGINNALSLLKIALFGEEEHGITMVAYKVYGMLIASRIIEPEKEKEQEQRSEVRGYEKKEA